MLDFILGAGLAALLIRGWLRGFVREILDLIGLVVGIWIAFRLSGPLGEFLTDRFSVSPEVATIGAGVVLFLLFGVSLSVAAHYLSKVMSLPGLNMINRAGGAGVAVAWGVAVVLVIVNVARVAPLPESWSDAMEESTVVKAIAGPDALPQRLFESFAVDDVLVSLQSLLGLYGESRLVPEADEVLAIPTAASDEIRQVREETGDVLEWLNEHRAGLGLRPLSLSTGLTGVAEQRAVLTYTTGRLSRENPPGRNVADDIARAGLRLESTGENLAMASSARAAWEGMLQSPTATALLAVDSFDRVGLSLVGGPTGRLLVIVFGG